MYIWLWFPFGFPLQPPTYHHRAPSTNQHSPMPKTASRAGTQGLSLPPECLPPATGSGCGFRVSLFPGFLVVCHFNHPKGGFPVLRHPDATAWIVMIRKVSLDQPNPRGQVISFPTNTDSAYTHPPPHRKAVAVVSLASA